MFLAGGYATPNCPTTSGRWIGLALGGPLACCFVGVLASWLYLVTGVEKVTPSGALVVNVVAGYTNIPLRPGDVVIKADAQEIRDGIDLAIYLSLSKSNLIQVQFTRNGTTNNGELLRQVPEQKGDRTGVGILFESQTTVQKLEIAEALRGAPGYALMKGLRIFSAIQMSLSKEAWQTLDFGIKKPFSLTRGLVWSGLIQFCMAMGILCLLPFPMLNGGKIVLCLIELITGAPVGQHTLDRVQTAIALVLIGLTVFIAFRDIKHIRLQGGLFSSRISGSPSYLRASERNPTWSF